MKENINIYKAAAPLIEKQRDELLAELRRASLLVDYKQILIEELAAMLKIARVYVDEYDDYEHADCRKSVAEIDALLAKVSPAEDLEKTLDYP